MASNPKIPKPPGIGRLVAPAIACLLLTGICWQLGLVPGRSGRIRAGQDLLASYAAGRLVAEGRIHAMYDRAGVADAERRIMRQSDIAGDARFLPWMNPPFAALPFALLSAVPYRTAALIWLAVNIGLAGISLSLLGGMLADKFPLPRTILLWTGVCMSMPFWQAMYAQQNTFVSLLLLCLAARFWMKGKGFWAGAIAGLMLFKPQLALAITVVLGISMGAEAIAGFVLVAAALLDVTAIALPGTLWAYVHQLPATVHWLQMELPYNWGRQTTLQGFWRLMIQGHAAGPTALLAKVLAMAGAAALGVPLSIAAWRSRGGDEAVRRRLIAAAIVCTPMLAPYCMDYDLLLLAVAAALTIAGHDAATKEDSLIAGGGSPGSSLVEQEDRGFRHRLLKMPLAWIAIAAALYLNPFVAANGRCNVAVIAIAAMAVLLIRNAFLHLPRITAADRLFPSARASALSR